MTIDQRLRKRGWRHHREACFDFWEAPRHIGNVTWLTKRGESFWLVAEGTIIEGQSLIDLAQRASLETKKERKNR